VDEAPPELWGGIQLRVKMQKSRLFGLWVDFRFLEGQNKKFHDGRMYQHIGPFSILLVEKITEKVYHT
jgi:hypothetical protein